VGKAQQAISTTMATPNSKKHQKHQNILKTSVFLRRYQNVGKKWRTTVFTTALLLVGVLSLIYSSRALADLVFYPVPTTGLHNRIVLRPPAAGLAHETDLETDLLIARQVVARRLEQLNLSGTYRLIAQDNQLTIMLPDHENTPYIVDIITHVGEIEFIDGGATLPPLGREIQTGLRTNPDQNVYRVLFSARGVEAVVPPDSGQIFYRLTLNATAAQQFADFMGTQSGHYVCMVIDKQVINCSAMYHWTDNTLDILPSLGSGAVVSLADLAIFLNSGPLPVPLQVER
jgi:preprotein translocase subunit SecD